MNVLVAVQLVRLMDQALLRGTQNAALANEAGDAARRVRAAAEAEQKQFIAGPEVRRQPAVAIADIFREPETEHAATQPVERMGADTLVVKRRQLPAAVTAAGGDQLAKPYDVGAVVGSIPGAIEQNGEFAGHVPPPCGLLFCLILLRSRLMASGQPSIELGKLQRQISF